MAKTKPPEPDRVTVPKAKTREWVDAPEPDNPWKWRGERPWWRHVARIVRLRG